MSAARPSTVSVTAAEPGRALARLLICRHQAHDDPDIFRQLADRYCRTTPSVAYTLERGLAKSAVGGGGLIDWGGGANSSGLSADAFGLLQGRSILPALAPRFRRVPWRIKIARESGAGAGASWRGEGAPAPATQSSFDLLEQPYRELSTIVVTTAELLKFGADIERVLTDLLANAIARFADRQLLDPTIDATTARPASLTFGAVAVASTGPSASEILHDLDALLAATSTPLDQAVWIMQKRTFARIAAALGAVGLSVDLDNLLGLPVIASANAPPQITLLDCAGVLYSSDDTLLTDVSSVTGLEMSAPPTQDGLSGVGAPLLSLFHTSSVAFRSTLAVSWQHAFFASGAPTQPAGCAYMPVAY
jgi:hypothetical protein